MRAAIELLAHAKRPMLMAGTSVKWSRAAGEMNRFIAETHIPTYTNGMGRGTVPPDSPEFLNRSRREALKGADCVILAGTLLDFRMAFGKTIPGGREDHPARHGRDADRPEPPERRGAGRQPRVLASSCCSRR